MPRLFRICAIAEESTPPEKSSPNFLSGSLLATELISSPQTSFSIRPGLSLDSGLIEKNFRCANEILFCPMSYVRICLGFSSKQAKKPRLSRAFFSEQNENESPKWYHNGFSPI